MQTLDSFGSENGFVEHNASHVSASPRARTGVEPRPHGGVLWMTGLPGAGKSTLANALKARLEADRCLVQVLDGDVLRTGLNAGLGFGSADRAENIRRAAEVAAMFKQAGFVVICALISPSTTHRQLARTIVGDRFFEVHIDSSLDVCESRDPKGLYAQARTGQLREFTGVSSPYEAPALPDVTIDTGHSTVDDSVDRLHAFVQGHIELRRFER